MKPPNRPQKGSSIRVAPIRDRELIAKIKANLANHPRDLCLFTMGINTAYRAGELLTLMVGQVEGLCAGDGVDLKQSKVNRYRKTRLNGVVVASIQSWLKAHPDPRGSSPLFLSGRGRHALTVSTVSTLVKSWCAEVGLRGNYASHTMRKTWGYHQRVFNGAPVSLLTRAYGHASEAQTMEYLGIQPEEIAQLYEMEL